MVLVESLGGTQPVDWALTWAISLHGEACGVVHLIIFRCLPTQRQARPRNVGSMQVERATDADGEGVNVMACSQFVGHARTLYVDIFLVPHANSLADYVRAMR